MRAVVQRVTRASVSVGGLHVAGIGAGLVVFVGVGPADDLAVSVALARKVAGLRVLAGDISVSERPDEYAVLVVSQFTLYGDVRKGRRPSWSAAAPGDLAEPLVAAVVAELHALGVPAQAGRFGADMQVELVNDGPVTLLIEL
ncbi:MAG: D-aminoacyl-tRNA deacylase [Jatrophihabitantaceae bacterium]